MTSIDDPRTIVAKLTLHGVVIELHADKSILVFADPDAFNVSVRAGRGTGAIDQRGVRQQDTGKLYNCVVISPLIPPAPAQPVAQPPSQLQQRETLYNRHTDLVPHLGDAPPIERKPTK